MCVLNEKEVKNLINVLIKTDEVKKEYYEAPILRELTEDEINEIHQMGKLTPDEWLKEMEEKYYDYCPLSNDSSRCMVFKNCHDCLVDYANEQGSFFPIFEWQGFALSDIEMDNLINTLRESEKSIKLVRKNK